MGCGRWVNNGLPRKGWVIEFVEERETADRTCEWCNTVIRFVFWLRHPEEDTAHAAGFQCAEKLSQDYVTARRLQKEYRERKRNLLRDGWQRARAVYGWYHPGYSIECRKVGEPERYRLRIGTKWGAREYPSLRAAKIRAFRYLGVLK